MGWKFYRHKDPDRKCILCGNPAAEGLKYLCSACFRTKGQLIDKFHLGNPRRGVTQAKEER